MAKNFFMFVKGINKNTNSRELFSCAKTNLTMMATISSTTKAAVGGVIIAAVVMNCILAFRQDPGDDLRKMKSYNNFGRATFVVTAVAFGATGLILLPTGVSDIRDAIPLGPLRRMPPFRQMMY